MNHEIIELNTLSKSFEFEKVCRTIDELSVVDARETAKAFCKLDAVPLLDAASITIVEASLPDVLFISET